MIFTEGRKLTGPAGTATEVLIEVEEGDGWPWTTLVGAWLLDCPGQSPAWRLYSLTAVHLLPVDGYPDPTLKFPSATHELLLYALWPGDPEEQEPGPTLNPRTWRMMTPVNAHEQVELPSHSSAADLLAMCARAVVDGDLPAEPPLSGQVEPWRRVVAETAAHLRGEHGDACKGGITDRA